MSIKLSYLRIITVSISIVKCPPTLFPTLCSTWRKRRRTLTASSVLLFHVGLLGEPRTHLVHGYAQQLKQTLVGIQHVPKNRLTICGRVLERLKLYVVLADTGDWGSLSLVGFLGGTSTSFVIYETTGMKLKLKTNNR
jgi:hypothetical protein